MISLVVATLNRAAELERLLASLEQQTYKDFEVLIVDQNSDDRVGAVLARHRDLTIRHLYSERGASRARNIGLRAASGSICAIPDDDSWYPSELLESISSWFDGHADFDVLVTCVRDEFGKLQGPRRRSRVGCACDKQNIWYNAMAISGFWRHTVIEDVGTFDELLGPGSGTRFQAGEEADFYVRALACGHRIWYEPSMSVFHPSFETIKERILEQTYGYASATGYVLRKHNYSIYRILKDFIGYSFAGLLVSLCRADVHTTRVRLRRVLGMVAGYVSAGQYLQAGNAAAANISVSSER